MNTTSDHDLFKKLVYVGINLQDILYGVELALYFRTMYALLNHPGERTRSDMFLAIFTSAMLLMATIWVFTQAIFCQKILGANSLVGPSASGWYMDLATMSPIVLQLMTDGLMLHRCWLIWGNYRVIIIPSILWAGALVLGIVANWTSTVTGGVYFHGRVVHLGLAYYGVSFFLTAMLSSMICYRLVWHGRLVKEHLGGEFASTHFTVVALVIESVLPCTLCGIAFLISFGMENQLMAVFGYIHTLLLCISPQMLILRVAMKRSTNDSNTELKQPSSTVKFSPQEQTTSGTVSDVPYAQVSESSPKGNQDMVYELIERGLQA